MSRIAACELILATLLVAACASAPETRVSATTPAPSVDTRASETPRSAVRTLVLEFGDSTLAVSEAGALLWRHPPALEMTPLVLGGRTLEDVLELVEVGAHACVLHGPGRVICFTPEDLSAAPREIVRSAPVVAFAAAGEMGCEVIDDSMALTGCRPHISALCTRDTNGHVVCTRLRSGVRASGSERPLGASRERCAAPRFGVCPSSTPLAPGGHVRTSPDAHGGEPPIRMRAAHDDTFDGADREPPRDATASRARSHR